MMAEWVEVTLISTQDQIEITTELYNNQPK